MQSKGNDKQKLIHASVFIRNIMTHKTNHITGNVLMINNLRSTQQAPTVFRSYISTREIKGA